MENGGIIDFQGKNKLPREAKNIKIEDYEKRLEALEKGGGGSGVEVVQETGQSTTAVMSQKATTDALGNKQDTLQAGSNITIEDNTINATDTTYSPFTGTDGETAGTAGLVPAPTTSDGNKFLKSDGTWTPETTYSNFAGTDGQTAGTAGLVPAPATTDAGKFLKADGTWGEVGGGAPFVITYSSNHFDKTLAEIKAAWDAHLPIWIWASGDGSLVQVSRMQNTSFPSDVANAYSNVTDSVCRLYGYSMQTTDNYRVGVKHWFFQMNTTTGNVIPDTYLPTKLATISSSEPSSVSNLSNEYSTLSQVGLKTILNKLVINGGTTAPTTSTVGSVGTLYTCVNNGTPEIYMCTDTTGGSYTWVKV